MLRNGRRLLLSLACLSLLAGCGRYANDASWPTGDTPAVHVVSTGETLYSISWQHGYDYQRVAEWNGIHPPYTIYPGQRLRLRAPTAADRSGEPRQDASVKKVRAAPQAPRTTGTSAGQDWRWPTEGVVVKTFKDDARGKKGIEIAGEPGQPVFASAPGRVVYSGDGLIGYGNLVIIKHDDTYLSAYAFNSRLLVAENDVIAGGQKIAEMGQRGGAASLHFEIRREGRPVDPLKYLPKQ